MSVAILLRYIHPHMFPFVQMQEYPDVFALLRQEF